MSRTEDQAVKEPVIDAETSKAAMEFAMESLRRIPKGSPEILEAHITGVLIVFWGALWGTFGTEFAKGFIEAQLNAMRPEVPRDRFTPPRTH